MRWWWPWTPKLRSDDDGSWVPKPKMRWWWLWTPKLKMLLWMSSWKCDDDGSECWKLRSDNDGSERRNWKCDSEHRAENVTMMALNAENWEAIMMTHERRNQKCDDDGSECRNWEVMMMALNAKLKMWWWWLWMPKQKMRWWWLWMPKLKMRLWTSNWKCDDDGSECRNWEATIVALSTETENVTLSNWKRGSERQGKKAALYAKQKMNDDSERQNEHVALNAKLRRNGGSERQAKNGWLCTLYLRMDGDSECQTTRKRW